MVRTGGRNFILAAIASWCFAGSAGCGHILPVQGDIRTDTRFAGNVQAGFNGSIDVKIPSNVDPGPLEPQVVRPGAGGGRVALIDVDGLILNQNLTGLYSVGENPVAAFREKLEAAARDTSVHAVVLRIHSPGGGVTASDIMAEEVRRFRAECRKPVVACLMDLATGGAYYLALGCDRILAHPTTITGGVGAIANHYNLSDAMAQLNVTADPVKSGDLVDMGTVTAALGDEPKRLLQEMTDGFRTRFVDRVKTCRRTMAEDEIALISDGRVVAAPKALELHMIDAIGYVEDAIGEAEKLAGVAGSEVILFARHGQPARSLYAVTPNVPLQSELVPLSYPGLDRTKLPTFLYMWQPDPTVSRLGGR